MHALVSPDIPDPLPGPVVTGSELGERLHRERRRRRDRQIDVAERFGVSQPTVMRWESGENMPERGKLPILADYLGMTLSEVLTLVEGGEPTTLDGLADRVGVMERDVTDIREAQRRIEEMVKAMVADVAELRAGVPAPAAKPALKVVPPADKPKRAAKKLASATDDRPARRPRTPR